jgi:hypothetical protein
MNLFVVLFYIFLILIYTYLLSAKELGLEKEENIRLGIGNETHQLNINFMKLM